MTRTEIRVYRDVMDAGDAWAERTRVLLRAAGVPMINLIGSPGSGKTRLLEETARRDHGRLRFAVLEGDVATTHDAERLQRVRVPVCQLLTDGGCHLPARMVHEAVCDLALDALDLLIVENVGNLVCPAQFDIGETAKVAVLSVTEGEDKPLKYPMLFREAKIVALTKTDLLPHLSFAMTECLANIRQINADAVVTPLSSVTGDGVEAWMNWLVALCRRDACAVPAFPERRTAP